MIVGILVLALIGFFISKRYADGEFQRGFRKGLEFGLKQKQSHERQSDHHRFRRLSVPDQKTHPSY